MDTTFQSVPLQLWNKIIFKLSFIFLAPPTHAYILKFLKWFSQPYQSRSEHNLEFFFSSKIMKYIQVSVALEGSRAAKITMGLMLQLLSHPFSFKTTFNHDHEDLLINKKFLTKFGGIRLGILQYIAFFREFSMFRNFLLNR